MPAQEFLPKRETCHLEFKRNAINSGTAMKTTSCKIFLHQLLLLSCTLLVTPAPAADVAGGKSLLQKYAGSYDTDALLSEPVVRNSLERLLGSEMKHLTRNLNVHGPVDLVSGSLSLSGNAAHGGGSEEAVLCVSTYNSTVSAAIFSRSTIAVFSEHPDYNSQDLCIKDWITLVNSGHRDRLEAPANVRIVKMK